jgi:hypothetical protein
MRLALNSGVALEPGTRAVYVKLWTESFADLDDAKLNAAFQKTLLTWGSEFGKVGKLPTVGDIRGHLDATAKKELASRADLEWQKLLDYIRRYYWADGPWQHKAPKLLLGLSSVDLALWRIKGRVSERGHDVPEADIRRRLIAQSRIAWPCFGEFMVSL